MDDAAKRLIYERNGAGTPRRGPRGSLGSSSDPEGRRIIAERLARARGMGGAVVYSPGEIKAEADTTNAILTQLYKDAEASPRIPQNLRYSFYGFLNEWVAFYHNHTSWTDRLWFSTLEKITDYRKRAEVWRAMLAQNGLFATAPPDAPPQPGVGLPEGALAKLGVAVAVLVGLFVAGKLVHTIMFGGPSTPLGAAEEAAVAIAESTRRKRHARRVMSIS